MYNLKNRMWNGGCKDFGEMGFGQRDKILDNCHKSKRPIVYCLEYKHQNDMAFYHFYKLFNFKGCTGTLLLSICFLTHRNTV
jgi:hypothetical protein